MRSFTVRHLIFILSTVAFSVFASPISKPADEVNAQKVVLAYIGCTDSYWHGICVKFVAYAHDGDCWNVPWEYNNQLSSIKPEPGQYCEFFRHLNCVGREKIGLKYPEENYDLNYGEYNLNDKISSTRCWTNWAPR